MCMYLYISSSSSFSVRFPCGSTGDCEARRLHQAQPDLAVFLWLDALPNANLSVSVVGAFYMPPAQVPDGAGKRPRTDGAFYVPLTRGPGEAGNGHDRATGIGARRGWQRPRTDGAMCHRDGGQAMLATTTNGWCFYVPLVRWTVGAALATATIGWFSYLSPALVSQL
ncbi:Hypothetical predicted protein [Octopus vulgaris]|uniref:Uncharacterized protein n=1 Tax=Octopus vulgaris TaxID=6645 RepID=A0AA36BTD5_OCTVU|nr:Hypothetical predicted protein [Octopus vulgaris]